MPARLEGRVAVVTGASRGIGKGIAVELGASGATVYVTGRTAEPRNRGLPGSLAETAEEISAAGGHGVPVECDHHDDAAVRAVFDQVRAERGHIDVLVNNVFSSPDLAPWLGKSFWDLPIEAWDQTIDIGLRSHYVASVLAVPLLINAERGLIVNISSPGASRYSHNVPYGVGKAGLDRMTSDMAQELRLHGVAVVSLWPGIVRTELVSMVPPDPEGRRILHLPGEGDFDLADAQTPRFVGRAVVTLAMDRDVLAWSGRAVQVDELAVLEADPSL